MNKYPAKFYHFYRHVQIHVWNTLTALNAWDLGRVHSATKCAKKDARTSKLLIFCMMKVINQIKINLLTILTALDWTHFILKNIIHN